MCRQNESDKIQKKDVENVKKKNQFYKSYIKQVKTAHDTGG